MNRPLFLTALVTKARFALLGLLAILVVSAGPGAALAEMTLHPRWELGAGVATLSMPDYRGSNEQRAYLFPVPYVVYRGEVLKVDREKVRGLLFKTEHLELDMSLNGSAPVSSRNNKARHGMPDLDPTIELGPQLVVLFSDKDSYRFVLYLPWRSVMGLDRNGLHATGWLANPVLNLDIKNAGPDKGWNLGISGGPLWADARLHDYFYGVDAAHASPDRRAYRTRGGYSGAQFTLALSKRYPRLWAGAFLRVNDLHGAVFEDSPLLKKKTSYLAGVAVTWVFAQSGQLVLSED